MPNNSLSVVMPTQAKKIEARRKSLELELLQEIESGDAPSLAGAAKSATTPAQNSSGSSTEPDSVERVPSEAERETVTVCEGKNKGNGGTPVDSDTPDTWKKVKSGNKKREKTKNEADGGGDEGGDNCDALAALAEEQRRLEEQDRLEHEAEMARLKK